MIYQQTFLETSSSPRCRSAGPPLLLLLLLPPPPPSPPPHLLFLLPLPQRLLLPRARPHHICCRSPRPPDSYRAVPYNDLISVAPPRASARFHKEPVSSLQQLARVRAKSRKTRAESL